MKKIVAWLTLAALVATLCVSLSGITVGAYDASYLKKWQVSEELLSSVSKANGGVPDFSDSVFSYECSYFGTKGIRATSYNPTGTSVIFGKTDSASQGWKSSLSLTTGDRGFVISSSSKDDMSIVFTAPASGEYVFSPEYLGGSYLDRSIYSSNGELDVTIKKGSEVIWSKVVSSKSYADFDELTVDLLMGEKLSVVFNAPGYVDYGYQFAANFFVYLIREEINTIVETPAEYLELNYNVAESLDVITSTTLTTDYDITPFEVISGKISPSNSWVKAKALSVDGYSWYRDHKYYNDPQYALEAHSADNSLLFRSINCNDISAIVFTAPETAEYSFKADSITSHGSVYGTFKILSEDYNEIYSGTKALDFKVQLYQGEKVYIYVNRGTDTGNWNGSHVTISNFNISASILVSPETYLDKDYQFQKNADDYIREAEYLIDDDDFLTVTIGGSSAYVYKIWVQQLLDEKAVWVPLEEIDYGQYALMNAYAIDGVFKFCIMAYDENGIPLTTSYFNHITEVKKEEAGGALLTNVFVNGTAVEDTVIVDKAKGEFKLEYQGVNIDRVEYVYEGVRKSFVDSTVIKPSVLGKVSLTLTAYSDKENALTDVRIVSIYVYDSKDSVDCLSINNVDVSLNDSANSIEINANATDGAMFSYTLFTFNSKKVFSVDSLLENTFSWKCDDKIYGYYTAKTSVKRSVYSGEDDKIYQTVYRARPNGSWYINATLDSSGGKKIYGTIGNSYELSANAWFSGSLGNETVQYAFYLKDYSGKTVIRDWSEVSSWSFTPAYAGAYVLGVSAKGSNALSEEIYKEFDLIVEGETAEGTVSLDIDNVNAGIPTNIQATYSNSENEIVYYRFRIYTPNYSYVIQDYSISNNCIWIPKTAGTYTIRVDVINQNSFGMYDVKTEKTVVVK